MITAAALIGGGSAIAGPLLGQMTKESGPDYNAASVNQSASLSASALMQQYNDFQSQSQILPLLYSYAGYSQPQIQSIMATKRKTLIDALNTTGGGIASNAWESGAHHQLYAAAKSLGEGAGQDHAGQSANLTGKFDEQFKFNPNVQDDPLYQYQRERGLAAIDKSTAAKGLTNSGYGAVLNSQFLNQLGAQEGSSMYGRQLGEYGLRAQQNQAGQQHDQNTFGRLMGTAQLGQNNNQFGAQLQQNAMNTGAQMNQNALQATGQQTQQNNAMNAQMYQQIFGGVSNAAMGAAGAYMGQQNANQWMDIARNQGRQFGGAGPPMLGQLPGVLPYG